MKKNILQTGARKPQIWTRGETTQQILPIFL